MGRLSRCELKIELLCLGVNLGSNLPQLARTRAGLGSGMEALIPGNPPYAVNIPVLESFAQSSPFKLKPPEEGGGLLDTRTGEIYPLRLREDPTWYLEKTSRGIPMGRVGTLQGSYLGLYVAEACGFWKDDLQCRFCTTGLNVGRDQDTVKRVSDVVEVCRAAKEKSGATFFHLNAGYLHGRELDTLLPYVEAIKNQVGGLVGVQALPSRDLSAYDRFLKAGVDHFSFCYEFEDPGTFALLCPGKELLYGQEAFYKALEYVQSRMPRGSCSGEIIAGVEPWEWTFKAIDRITSLGAFPTVCVFRPLKGSGLQGLSSPKPQDVVLVMKKLWRSCRDRWIPVGLAPNLRVSLVVQPDETADLAPGTPRDFLYKAYLSTLRTLAGPLFRRRMRPRDPSPPIASAVPTGISG